MSEKCNQMAAVRYTWPGRDESYACIEHAMKLKEIAEVLGLHLQFIPLAYSVTDEIPNDFPLCQQEIKKVRDE